ncbi:hypothetical protein [Nocardioides sp.]|uniref:hypothetical protein n=1 Tax=Nocardioides sp. TaxID=35761 RepID=UPI00261BDCE8|nr:hypothetical protein [Nocardioides sp.]MCW2738859.1 hypothetical protein [Nocardioides sp.]
MTELDYAYLAEYAKVSEGLLTAVGASYTVVQAKELGRPFNLAVAGRIRAFEGESPTLGVEVFAPEERYQVGLAAQLSSAGARPYGDGQVGILFALTLPIPLIDVGIYSVSLKLNDAECRVLRFEVEQA